MNSEFCRRDKKFAALSRKIQPKMLTETLASPDITKRDLVRGKRLLAAAIGAPVAGLTLPLILTFVLTFLFGGSPPAAITIFFFGMLGTAVTTLIGLIFTIFFLVRRSSWRRELRERIAARGITSREIDWFRAELQPKEKKTLDGLRSRDPLLADTYADYLASKLTATRITRSARRELSLMQRRQRKLRLLGTEGAKALEAEIEGDIAKITDIQTRAKDAIAEAQTGIERVEATFARGGTLNDSDITLKKLSARTADLPHALEKVRLTEEIRKELEKEDEGE
ncbi:MAG: hypothetical protein LC113_13140 [Acidobacteria bacterium]|nr:hypothetical protein [Acidobacteriota bacterium]